MITDIFIIVTMISLMMSMLKSMCVVCACVSSGYRFLEIDFLDILQTTAFLRRLCALICNNRDGDIANEKNVCFVACSFVLFFVVVAVDPGAEYSIIECLREPSAESILLMLSGVYDLSYCIHRYRLSLILVSRYAEMLFVSRINCGYVTKKKKS